MAVMPPTPAQVERKAIEVATTRSRGAFVKRKFEELEAMPPYDPKRQALEHQIQHILDSFAIQDTARALQELTAEEEDAELADIQVYGLNVGHVDGTENDHGENEQQQDNEGEEVAGADGGVEESKER